jgi:hypothetical protein
MSSLTSLTASIGKGQILLPVLNDFLAKEEADVQKGAQSKKKGVIDDAKLTVSAFKERIAEFNHGEEIKGDYFHPSALGGCLRATWFAYLNAPGQRPSGDDPVRTYLTFEQGTYIHVILQNLCARAGILVEREITIQNAKLRTLGHADAVIKIEGVKYVLEIKSSNSRNFMLLTKEPKHEHKMQLHDYMRCLNINQGIILYMDKDRGTLKEFVVHFDREFYMEHVFRRKNKFFKALHSLTPPKVEGFTLRSPPCSYCKYAGLCYSPVQLRKFVAKKQKFLNRKTP